MAGLSLNNSSFNKGVNPKFREREDQFSASTIKELNTYSTWDEQQLINDVISEDFEVTKDKKGKETVKSLPPKKSGKGIKSIFNKYTLVPILTSEVRDKLNAPLVDSSDTRRKIKEMSNPSIKNLVQASLDGKLGRETYSYSDFMYCKHLGSISNNYLITLRRFPIAVGDYIGQISDSNTYDDERRALSLGCMVTWLGTPGNDMSNILKYNFKMPFKELTAEIQDVSMNDQSSPLGNMFAAFDSKYQAQVQSGYASAAIKPFGEMLGIPFGDAPYTNNLNFKDSNKIYGPVDVVKKTHRRGDDGLTFEHNFSLTFEYELRSYSNINTRQAMLDLIANILTVTYVNGSFFPGGFRGLGPHQSDLFSNLKCMNTRGGVTEFIDAFAKDISTVSSSISDSIKKQGGILNTLKNLANNFGGMLLGGMLNKMGRPQKQAVNSLLSPAPVGLWHVTIGNPFHPIMSIGNLILDDTEIRHEGPLGLDDFPTKLIVTCKLKAAKGRDAKDIELLYNHGAVRMYSGMEEFTEDIIKKAPNYNKNTGDIESKYSNISAEITDNYKKIREITKKAEKNITTKDQSEIDALEAANKERYATLDSMDMKSSTIYQYFYSHNRDAIKQAGMEWLRGGGSKTKQANTGKANNNKPKPKPKNK